MASTGSTGSPLPKWQIAVILGATGAIGLGFSIFIIFVNLCLLL